MHVVHLQIPKCFINIICRGTLFRRVFYYLNMKYEIIKCGTINMHLGPRIERYGAQIRILQVSVLHKHDTWINVSSQSGAQLLSKGQSYWTACKPVKRTKCQVSQVTSMNSFTGLEGSTLPVEKNKIIKRYGPTACSRRTNTQSVQNLLLKRNFLSKIH